MQSFHREENLKGKGHSTDQELIHQNEPQGTGFENVHWFHLAEDMV
jgi:hypothetical protein